MITRYKLRHDRNIVMRMKICRILVFINHQLHLLVLQARHYPAVRIDKHACGKFTYEISACYYTWSWQNLFPIAIYKFPDVTFVTDTVAHIVHTISHILHTIAHIVHRVAHILHTIVHIVHTIAHIVHIIAHIVIQ
jgi:hypothetical protein